MERTNVWKDDLMVYRLQGSGSLSPCTSLNNVPNFQHQSLYTSRDEAKFLPIGGP